MPHLTPIDHKVKHKSTIPANYDTEIELFVREYEAVGPSGTPKPVLMLRGRSTPASPAATSCSLRTAAPHTRTPATAGRRPWRPRATTCTSWTSRDRGSPPPRPKMDDQCNANPAQRGLLETNPGTGNCPQTAASYPHQLGNSKSEWDELGTVVKFIRQRCANEKVSFVGWSAASFVMGPYALQNPGDVARLFLLAPMFPPNG